MPPGSRVPELDSIRGIAILLVIFWHYGVEGSPGLANAFPFQLAWSGVDLFFVLSGFLIGGNLLAVRDSERYYRTFYWRRSFRILPLYVASLLLYLALAALLANPASEGMRLLFGYELPFWSYPVFLQNWFMAWRQHYGSGWLAVTWSLAVEEQFYLLLPLVVRHWTGKRLAQMAAGAFLVALGCRLALAGLGNPVVGPYTLLPCRLDAFAGGLLVAIARRDGGIWSSLIRQRGKLAVAAVVMLVVMIGTKSQIWQFSLLAAFYSLLLVLVLTATQSGVLRHQALQHVGLTSYFLYLFHQPLNGLLHHGLRQTKPATDSPYALAVTAGSLVLVIGLATFSWRYVEGPLVRYAQGRYRY